jgi:hypothetical protein
MAVKCRPSGAASEYMNRAPRIPNFHVRIWLICKLKESLPSLHLVLLARRDPRRMAWRSFR